MDEKKPPKAGALAGCHGGAVLPVKWIIRKIKDKNNRPERADA